MCERPAGFLTCFPAGLLHTEWNEMTVVNRCWAMNENMDRCGKRASHKGAHSITIEWDDDQCFNYDKAVELAPEPTPIKIIAPVVDITQCVACNHRHADGPCKCGCYEFVG